MAKIEIVSRTTSSLNLRISELGGSSYSTMWIKVGNATKNVSIVSGTTYSTTQSFTGLTAGEACACSFFIQSSGGSTGEGTATIYTRPNTPTGLSYTGVTSSSATATWNLPTGNYDGFRIVIRYSSGTNWKENTATRTSYQSTFTVNPSTTYSFAIVSRIWESYTSSYVESSSTTSSSFTTPSATVQVGNTSVTLVTASNKAITVHYTAATNATSYVLEVYTNSSYSSGYVGRAYGYSNGGTILYDGLNPNTTYYLKVFATNGQTNSLSPYTGSKMTLANMISGNLSITNITSTGFRVSWNHSTGKDYAVRIYNSSNSLIVNTTTTSNVYTFTSGSANSYYSVRISPRNNNNDETDSTIANQYTAPNSPTNARLGTATANSFAVLVNAPTGGAARYRAMVYNASGSSLIGTFESTTTTISVTGLYSYTNYLVEVFAVNSNNIVSATSSSALIRTKDNSPPIVNILTVNTSTMSITWSASDSQSGIRAVNPYQVQITNRNGTTYYSKGYTSNQYYTFINDGNNVAFVVGAKYYMRVIAYDEDGNEAIATTGEVTFDGGRPTSFTWHTAKISGNAVNITADEWNSLCTRVNNFRVYKGLANATFTTAVTGNVITAAMFNQVRNAINAMSPPTAPPTIQAIGDQITAQKMNGLVSSLNSIQ